MQQQTANNTQLEQPLSAIFRYTVDSLDKMNCKDLSIVTLLMAKIVNSIREANHARRMNFYHQALGSILQKMNPFGRFAKAADR
jgi:hypothetical protein